MTMHALRDTNEAISRTRHWRRGGALGVAVLALAGGWAWHRHSAAAPVAAPAQAPLVSVVVPGKAQVAATITATGTLAARHEMPVGSVGDGGQVQRVLVNAGDWVRQGQLLVVVDRSVQREQAANQQAQISVAQADARLAEANLQRALKLVDRGFISRANIDQLNATRDAALARVRIAQAQMGEIGARIRRLDIVAPADGFVLERDVEPGQVVGPASGVLFRIAEKGEMELRARLAESDLARLRLGQDAQVTPLGATTSHTGHIWQIAPMIDAITRQGTARIALPYAPDLRPGGFANARIASGQITAPVLPESALQADAQGSYVYVVGRGNRVERRAITTGLVTDTGVAITAGLSGGESVVLRAGAFLTPGETVEPHRVAGA